MNRNEKEFYSLPKTPSVRYFTDSNGSRWICYDGKDLNQQTFCVREDEVVYDRGFGG